VSAKQKEKTNPIRQDLGFYSVPEAADEMENVGGRANEGAR
jgi:hypothetical protein